MASAMEDVTKAITVSWDAAMGAILQHVVSPLTDQLLCCAMSRKPINPNSPPINLARGPSFHRRAEAYPACELTLTPEPVETVNLRDIRDVPPAELERLGTPKAARRHNWDEVPRPPGMEFPRPRH